MRLEIFSFSSLIVGKNLTHEDELAVSPRYYGYTKHGGLYIIIRKTDTGDGTYIYEFSSGTGKTPATYATDWANRDS